jgi:ectoine hydroxylase-related dioxygenase (phytanoyl-CoA dioxygenase family)
MVTLRRVLLFVVWVPVGWPFGWWIEAFSPTTTKQHDVRVESSVIADTAFSRTSRWCSSVGMVATNVNEGHDDERRRFMYMTPEQDQILKTKGEYEQSLMQTPRPLKPIKVRGGSSTAGGFGGGEGSSVCGTAAKKKPNKGATSRKGSSTKNQEENRVALRPLAKTLQVDGVIRIDNVLSAQRADALRDYLIDLRARGTSDIESGKIKDSQERFADVLLNQNRCDLKIPLGPLPVNNALHELLAKKGTSIVRDLMEYVFDSYGGVGKDAELWELNCFMSNSGARRQLVHADVVSLEPVIGLMNEQEPIVLTCFVALQDIDSTMGPTVWMPGTHTLQAHNQFFETGVDKSSTATNSCSPKDSILKSTKSVLGTIPKGACVIFDPRVLHCAGANTCVDQEKTRALFYVSFKNPKIDNPGCPSTSGYGVATAAITMEALANDLRAEQAGEPTKRIQLISCFP